jgi:hypothetical protein
MLIAAATVSTTLADFFAGEWAEDSIVDPFGDYCTPFDQERLDIPYQRAELGAERALFRSERTCRE